MIQWIKEVRSASFPIKNLVFQSFLYGIAIILSAVYAYGRLDFVRSGKQKTNQITKTPAENAPKTHE